MNNRLFPKISFFIPVYNEEKKIERCLRSILKQDYPKDKIEILVVDGGSQDKTKEIAVSFECVKIFDNPKRLADFGIKICVNHVGGELFIVFAADNELASLDWLSTIAELFMNEVDLASAWCRMGASEDDDPINKYYELIQNDPLSFFVNKNLEQYLKQAKIVNIKEKDCYVFLLDKYRPLIWGANGLVYRTKLVKDIILKEGFIGDNDVFQTVIERGFNKVAYIKSLTVYHHHVKNIKQWVNKWRRDFGTHFLQHRKTRNMGWIFDSRFKNRLILWMLYVLILPFILIHTIYLVIRDNSIYWFYHPFMNFFQLATYLYSALSTRKGRNLVRDLLLKRLA